MLHFHRWSWSLWCSSVSFRWVCQRRSNWCSKWTRIFSVSEGLRAGQDWSSVRQMPSRISFCRCSNIHSRTILRFLPRSVYRSSLPRTFPCRWTSMFRWAFPRRSKKAVTCLTLQPSKAPKRQKECNSSARIPRSALRDESWRWGRCSGCFRR